LLFPLENFICAISVARCVISNVLLPTQEFVVSQTRVPSLYNGSFTAKDKGTVQEIVKLIVQNAVVFRKLFDDDAAIKLNIRRFFGLCLTKGDAGNESYLHAYMYLFWDDIVSEANLARELHSPAQWGSKEFGVRPKVVSGAEETINERLSSAGVELDLFTWSPKRETLTLIEIKRGECDDRAIGQLLRYYQVAWGMLSTHEFRTLKVNYIWPILVVSKVREAHWNAIPLHFRGMLDILIYQTSSDGVPTFQSFRNAAITNRWG
jgi:hypothetical protein